jgi:protein O-GlcNAc transferase
VSVEPSRNALCSCGSGKKYKNCCLGKTEFRPAYPSTVEVDRLVALSNARQYAELEIQTRSLIRQYPNTGFIWKLLGESLYMQGKDALHALHKATVLLPNDVDTFNNLALVLTDLGRLDEAVSSCRRALEIKPDDARAHNNLGNALLDLGRPFDAVASLSRAIEINPDYFKAHNNLGNALQDMGRYDDAAASYRRALELKPDNVYAFSNLLFCIHYIAHSPEYHLEEARKFGQVVGKGIASRFSNWQCADRPVRLRVGLVSGDLNNHPVGFFLESLLAQLDHTRVELIAYPTHGVIDELTTRIRPYFAEWKPLPGLSDEAAARLIHGDGVHVLIDLAGHTSRNRLPVFAWKPAPVQASWLGYFATTGLAEMDYLLADKNVVPHAEEGNFTEAIWRLPESYMCFTEPAHTLDVARLPALTTGYVTFGCFNNLVKMNDAVVALWARVLQAVPGSRLFLKTKQLSDSMICEATRQRFARRGISPDRLLLEGGSPRAELLAAYRKVDIALDPFPYPGGTTSVEALWMGVPVITRCGDRFLAHVGETIAHNAGLSDWIAADEDNYVAKAVTFTSDLERLNELRAGLREQVLASPLFDAPRFARNFEAALWGMWQACCDKRAKGKE